MKQTLNVLCVIVLLAALACLPIAAFSEASEIPEGTEEPTAVASDLLLSAVVTGKREIVLKAPASGELDTFSVRAGDAAASYETLFSVLPTKVYADISGTVAAVYVQPGDIADPIVARYGGAVMIERERRYEVQANTRTGRDSAENRDLHVGTSVYLRSVNEKYTADGVIITVNGDDFTVEVIGGDLQYNQDVRIYLMPDHSSKSLLARAALLSVAPYAQTAAGTVVDVRVKAGDSIKAGDYLFAYVPDTLEPDKRGRSDALDVKTDEALVVKAISVAQGATVQKGQTLLTAYALGDYQLVAQAEESDVHKLKVGDSMTVRFEELDLPALTATVASISPLGSDGDIGKYSVYFDFEAPDGVWIGMHATVGGEH